LPNGYCAECALSSSCSGTKPICQNNACIACAFNSDCSGKDATKPKCKSDGSCQVCLADADCSGGTAYCRLDTNTCVACLLNSHCTATSATPICSAYVCSACTTDVSCSGVTGAAGSYCATSGSNSGKCVQCTADSQCSGTTPICSSNVCSACASNSACSTKNSAIPKCKSDGSCQVCLANADCTVSGSPICDSSSNTCRACNSDTDCSGATSKCNTVSGNCVACYPGGQNAACTTATSPICSSTSFTCVACDSSNACSSPNICVTSLSIISNSNTGACVTCTQNSHCSGTTPICVANSCAACTTDAMCTGSGNSANAVVSGLISLAYCQTATGTNKGSCVQCTVHSHCSGLTPLCINFQCSKCAVSLCSQLATPNLVCATNTATTSTLGSCFTCSPTNCLANTGPTTPVCSAGACVPCSLSNTCAAYTSTPVCSDANDGKCVQCNLATQATDCQYSTTPTTTTPICVSHTCSACSTNAQCATLASATPICNSGPCVQCLQDSDCSTNFPLLPYCNTVTKKCQVCKPVTNAGCTGSNSICDSTNPTYVCRPCNAGPNSNLNPSADCSGSKSYCSLSGTNQGKCVACTDSQAHCIASTPTTITPVCSSNNICVACSATNTCPSTTPNCYTTTGALLGSCFKCASATDNSCFTNTGTTSSLKPVCTSAGSCVACNAQTGANSCSSITLAPACKITGSTTGPTCVQCNYDNDCSLLSSTSSLTSSTPYCVNNICVSTPSTSSTTTLQTYNLILRFTDTFTPDLANPTSAAYTAFVAKYKAFVIN
jgi:hypothetical protein